jgi:hypothetical protein
LAQGLAVDRDVAQRLGDHGGEEDRLPGEQVHLAEEALAPVADDLAPGRVPDRDLARADRDERVGLVADLEQHLPDRGRALLPVPGEGLELRAGEHSGDWSVHRRKGTQSPPPAFDVRRSG